MHRAPSQRSLRLWMGLAFATIATALGVANLVVALSLVPQVRMAREISERYVRAVDLLAAMRGQISQMRGAIALVHAPGPGRNGRASTAEATIAAAVDALGALEHRYVPLVGPEEAHLWQPLGQERLPQLARDAAAVVAGVQRDPYFDVALTAFLLDAESADRALERLEDVNALRATRAATEIEASLRRFAVVGVLLALVGGGAALAMFLLAHVALRRWAVANEQRASDLEAFASRVAHDLRTPLQAVLLSFATIARSAPVASAACERGRRNVERLQGLIDDLLVFSRAATVPEAGAATPVHVVLEELREEIEPRARASGAELRILAEPGLSVAASPGAVRAIASNLIENALRYLGESRERRVEVHVASEGLSVRLEVRDTGPGIAPEVVPHIFEPFYRATSVPGGLGIGLATVRRLVEAHGGRIRVATAPGKGTTFVVVLPRAA
ncbi:sensor histidine kinase [Anaeromyxobacter oryzae]|uniref:histidine kinase n=1 Tax=Anaeromyxobacter oryzae TaxID=2918170 RepID=A0ABM7X3C6_9BACT|nr:HAMP domain-containing sensor histidine kinase [Anaeromyxobacter oryzae]BDG06302.1 hypothetical protein AMOR_52980 [Anaeromyxobacter oryzae]